MIALVCGALLVTGVARFCDRAPEPGLGEVCALLSRLERECDPDSPTNIYQWTTNAPPTERNRRLILEKLHALQPAALAEVRRRLPQRRDDEFGEMLIVTAAALGDTSQVLHAARIMAYSEYPGVRLSAARELAKLRDPRTIEWFEYAAKNDDRVVRNDACGNFREYFYPVRTTAALALKDFKAAAAN